MSVLRIGALSTATGVKVETIRYYERIGLLNAPQRSQANYRVYDADDRHRLRFIKRTRNLGFSIDEIRALLRLSDRKEQACGAVDRISSDHLVAIKSKITDLQRLATELKRINDRCRGGGKIKDCRIIEALAGA